MSRLKHLNYLLQVTPGVDLVKHTDRLLVQGADLVDYSYLATRAAGFRHPASEANDRFQDELSKKMKCLERLLVNRFKVGHGSKSYCFEGLPNYEMVLLHFKNLDRSTWIEIQCTFINNDNMLNYSYKNYEVEDYGR